MTSLRLCLRVAIAIFALIPPLALAPAAAAKQRIDLRIHKIETYIPEFRAKKRMNARYRPMLDPLLGQRHREMEAGRNLLCSSQIFEEIHWLVNYTDRRDDIERRIADLKESLGQDDQSAAARQDPEDGSFAPCMESWIWRFFRSVDPLKEMARRGERPEVPLGIWEPVDTPEELTAYMQGLLVSDLSGGHNKRKELNLAVTALGQLLWLDYTAAVFPAHLDRAALAEALRRFVDETWQDAETGYWGAWYRDGEEIHKTEDLSMTFHIISYLDGDVAHKREIASTLAATREVKYPYGWDMAGTQNNHHAYDIARIVNLTWEDIDPNGRANANASLFLLLTRSLALSIDASGRFDPAPYTTVGEAYYFGISFFAEMGLFGNEVPNTGGIRVTNTEGLLQRIRQNLDGLDQSDPWIAAAKRKLDELVLEPEAGR